jgi:hypothetical protein
VYVASNVVTAASESEALASLAGLHVPGQDAVIEAPEGNTSSGGIATLLDDEPGSAIVRVDTSAPGFLIFNEGYGDGGWQSDVDGRSTAVIRANYVFQAVAVPSGTHYVRFRYWPQSLTIGIAISAVAIIVILALSIPPGTRSRRRRASTS